MTSTVVSSRLIGRICNAAEVHHVETPTGFKWLCRPGIEHPEWTQVLCYEEAMGYAVGADARDKDGITAAAVVSALAAELAGVGQDLLGALDDLARIHGAFVTRNASIELEERPPITPALVPAEAVRADEPAPGTLRWWLPDDTRIALRRSGTEPRLKYYCEAIRPVGRGGPDAARRECERRLDEVETALLQTWEPTGAAGS